MRVIKKIRNRAVAVSGCLALASTSAMAQIDASEAVTAVEGVAVPLTAVGGAIIGLAALAMSIRWVKATFF